MNSFLMTRSMNYAVEIRYPDDYFEIYENDAKEAFKIAKEVKAYIYSKVSW